MLTWTKGNGTWGLKNFDIRKIPGEVYGAVCKLQEYEQTGLTPGQITEMDILFAEKCRKVAQMEKHR